MRFRDIIIATLLAFFAVSCSVAKKEPTPIDRLTQMSEQLDKKDVTYTEVEWEALGLEIEEIEEEVQKNRDKYTDEELREINRLKGKCLAKMAKKAVNDLAGEIGNFLKDSEGIFGGFMEEVNRGEEVKQ